MKDIHDIIMHAKFGDDRLRGSGVVAGQVSAFPIDFAGRPYNTLTLPCERVIMQRLKRHVSVIRMTNRRREFRGLCRLYVCLSVGLLSTQLQPCRNGGTDRNAGSGQTCVCPRNHVQGCTSMPQSEYDGLIFSAQAMRAVATITVATSFITDSNTGI